MIDCTLREDETLAGEDDPCQQEPVYPRELPWADAVTARNREETLPWLDDVHEERAVRREGAIRSRSGDSVRDARRSGSRNRLI